MSLSFNRYQTYAQETAVYDKEKLGLIYSPLKLAGEAGEVADKFGKFHMRGEPLTDEFRQMICKELGDVLWHLSDIAYVLGIPLEEVARVNLDKTKDRKQRGVLLGDGDNR